MHAKLIKADFHGSIMTGELRGSFGAVLFLRRGSERENRGGFLMSMCVLYTRMGMDGYG
jgi:hypothetical protein